VSARCLCALFCLFAAGVARAQATTGELGGVVLDRATERPLVGVTVTLVGSDRSAITDEDGRFRLTGAPAGRHTLTIAPPDAAPLTVDEEIVAGRRRDVRYLVAPVVAHAGYQSTVRAPRVERAGVIETGVVREEARRVAGTADDPLKVVEDLPGVARATVGTGDLIVWGAAPADTRVVIDGVEWPALYHVGGWRSTVAAGLVASVTLTPGGFGAEWGLALGGLVRVEGAAPPPAGVHGEVGVDVLDGSALLSYARGRFAVTVAGRYSWLDRLAGVVVRGDAAAFIPLPRWDDYQLRASVALRARERLTLTVLAADDTLRREVSTGDPTAVHSDRFDRSSYRAILRYEAELDGAAVEATPFFGYDRSRTVDQFGLQPANLEVRSWVAGLRAAYRRRLGRLVVASAGLDLLDTHAGVTRLGSLTIPPREGDVTVFGQPPGDDVAAAADAIHQLDVAPFVSVDVHLGPVTVTPGLRADALLLQGNHIVPPIGAVPTVGWSRFDWSVDPRLQLRWQAHPRVAVVAAGGIYHQPPDPADLGARFGNPTLGPSRAVVATAGVEARLTATLSAEATGFYRQLDDLVTRSPLPSPPVAAALVQDGIGRSYGAQLSIRAAPWRGLSGWLSYTGGRSERRDHPTSAWRLFDYDQTHILTLVASYVFRRWDFGVRLRYASGFPRTPVVGAYFDARDARYDPLFGAQNSIRIPDFVQLDVRAEYAFVWARAALRLYLDVQNVTYQRNAEELAYSPDYAQRAAITGLPTLAVLGARVLF
jgi:carboxypeptidase family protein